MNSVPSQELADVLKRFETFCEAQITPHLPDWVRRETLPRDFFQAMGSGGWFGYRWNPAGLSRPSALRQALLAEKLATISAGAAVAAFTVHVDLGLVGLDRFGSETLRREYLPGALNGDLILCLGNTEAHAGSDVAHIGTAARPVQGGWLLKGTKAYVTNGAVADLVLITAVSDPDAPRNRRLSMFLVGLDGKGVQRRKLDKPAWLPADLTRIKLDDVFVPDHHLLGERGRGLSQVLQLFTHSRVGISALTLGTAVGAFNKALVHARQRKISARPLLQLQAKAFEAAELYADIEAARLMVHHACAAADSGRDFRLEASLAKFLSVKTARAVTTWAADLFGAASVLRDHPIHNFPLDAWAASLGEGTQDVHKLIIARELMRNGPGSGSRTSN